LNLFQHILRSNKKNRQGSFVRKLNEILPFKPKNIEFYREALTHKSKNVKDEQGNRINFERLEFLGDAIIEAIISEYLFKELPYASEGELTIMRSKIVSRKHLNELGDSFNIINLLHLDIPTKQLGNNISGNLYEALSGAIFLDQGYKAAKSFIFKTMIIPHIDLEKLNKKISSYKSFIIEWAQKNHYTYEFLAEKDYNNGYKNYFKVNFFLNNKKISHGRSSSKKKAEEIAARRAYFILQLDKNGQA